MVYEIIPIWLGRISSPKNTRNNQGPFFHRSCHDGDSTILLWRLSKCSRMEASINLQGNTMISGWGSGKGWLALIATTTFQKQVELVVEVSGCQRWSRESTQNRTNLLFKTKTICTYCKGSSTLRFQVDKSTGFTEKRLKSTNPRDFSSKQSWTSRVCMYVYIYTYYTYLYIPIPVCSRWHHTWEDKKNVVIEGNGILTQSFKGQTICTTTSRISKRIFHLPGFHVQFPC